MADAHPYRFWQAIQNCKDKTYREVLPLLESLMIGTPNIKVDVPPSIAQLVENVGSAAIECPPFITS